MHWQTLTNLISTIIFSIFYVLVGILNLSESNPHMSDTNQTVYYPFVSILYIFVSLAISWGIFSYYRKRPSELSFLVTIITGMVIIFVGLFLWKIT